jgi:hypothetical protein
MEGARPLLGYLRGEESWGRLGWFWGGLGKSAHGRFRK